MIVRDVEIPDAVIERLTRVIQTGERTAAALEVEAVKILLTAGITDTERRLAPRLVSRLTARVREAAY